MMKIGTFILALLLILIPSFALADDEIEISFTRPENAPYFEGIPRINIYSEEFTTVTLSISSKADINARLLWASSYDPQFNEQKSIMFSIKRSDAPRKYVFNLKTQNAGWAGFIKQFVVAPDQGVDGMTIHSASVSHTTLGTLISSGWREFWGPSGRIIMGSTVNNMRTLTLWGRPFNYYLYALIILTALASYGYIYSREKALSLSWRGAGSIAMLACLMCWAVWQLSFLVTEYSWIKADLNKYGSFTTLEYKQKAALGEYFYDYLQFCRKELPQRAQTNMITSDTSNFYFTKAIYYLYPIILVSKDPKYLLVFMNGKTPGQTMAENKGFRLLKKFDEGAYILWKK